jgi:methyl-accepting chemotaxis protein
MRQATARTLASVHQSGQAAEELNRLAGELRESVGQ